MAGLYLHIPFCRKACSYCNFHFSTARQGHQEMVDAIAEEIGLRNDEMPTGDWQTVYFGGGTPSLLSPKQVEQLIAAARLARPIAPRAEITLEANPDDLSEEVLKAFAKTEVNRLSIGVQSFRDSDLAYMNRAHNSKQAIACIARAQAAGFSNLTIDLIYGTPGLSDQDWRDNLQRAVDFGVQHVSAYALTVEPKTALAHQIQAGKSLPVNENQAARQMEILVDVLEAAGYEQYEVSNFALPNYRARHNSKYWLGAPYLGVGPSAHSYDGGSVRSWNVANNARYVKAIEQGELPLERETLDARERYHELILTRLRTVWGVNRSEVAGLGFEDHFLRELAPFIQRGLVVEEEQVYRLSKAGKLLADGVSAALFVDS